MDEELVDDTMAHTPRHLDGFAKRLDEVLVYVGIPDFGKLTKLGRYADMSPAGVRKLFELDRPPKTVGKLRALVDGIIHEMSTLGQTPFNREALISFLLHDTASPLPLAPQEKHILTDFDPVELGKLYVFLDQRCKVKGINMFEDLPIGALKMLIHRVLAYCANEAFDLSSAPLQEFMDSAIVLAKEDLL